MPNDTSQNNGQVFTQDGLNNQPGAAANPPDNTAIGNPPTSQLPDIGAGVTYTIPISQPIVGPATPLSTTDTVAPPTTPFQPFRADNSLNPAENSYQQFPTENPVSPTQPLPPPPATVNIPQSQPPGFSNVIPSEPKRGKSKLFLIIVILLILGGLAAFVLKLLTPATSQKTEGTVTWWGLWEDPVIIQPLIAEYESQHQGVKINYVKQSPQDYRERLTSALAKGGGPDIFAFHNTWVPMFKTNLDALPASVMNPADFAKTFYPIASSDLSMGSSIVGIPLEYDGLILYINEEIFEKAGKSPPTTWDDYRNMAKSLTVKDVQGVITQAGAAMGRTENVDHWPEILALLMIQNGVNLSNPTGKTAEDALTFFTIFSTADGVWDAGQPTSTQAFAAGKLAMYIGPSWRAFDIIQQNPNLRFKAYPIPQLPKDNPNQADITYATYWAQGVSSSSENKALAWEFLKFMSTKETLTKFYSNASKYRNFGEPYPRVDMQELISNHPLAGAVVAQAPGAESWYLASRTFDGPTGINSLMANYFEDAVNAMAKGTIPVDQILKTAAAGVSQVLAQYKLVTR
jgi:ABC-type glycerol-3-phosphate transport system substrate-binding protein